MSGFCAAGASGSTGPDAPLAACWSFARSVSCLGGRAQAHQARRVTLRVTMPATWLVLLVVQGLTSRSSSCCTLQACQAGGQGAGPPGQDGDLPRDVHAGQVVPRVGLCVPPVLGLGHDLGEGRARHKAVEDVGQRACTRAPLRAFTWRLGRLPTRLQPQDWHAIVRAATTGSPAHAWPQALLHGQMARGRTGQGAPPEKMPSTRVILSPVSRRCFNVAMTGSPAPTVACASHTGCLSHQRAPEGGPLCQQAVPRWVEDVSSKPGAPTNCECVVVIGGEAGWSVWLDRRRRCCIGGCH